MTLCVASLGVAFAQIGQVGSILGRVSDPSGGVMAGVTVTATKTGGGLQPMVATSSADGTYEFPNIPIGTYSVKYELTGYRTAVRENIGINIGFNAVINVQLELATLEQTVEVTSAAPIIDTQSTTVTAHFEEERLQELPTGRGQYNMIEEAPSVQSPSKDNGGATNGQLTQFIFRGSNPNQTRFFMDGSDLAPSGSSQSYWMDYDSIKEMVISQSGSDVTQMSAAMAINMVSKSGGDQIHGSVHMDYENEALENTNLSMPQREAALPFGGTSGNPLKQLTDWGGEMGGPIKKGKLWYWGDWTRQSVVQGDDKVFQLTDSTCVPVAANPLGYSYGRVRECTHGDPVVLKHVVGKIGWSPFHNNTLTFMNRYDVKEQALFGYTALRLQAATWRLSSPCPNETGNFGPRFWDCGWPDLWRIDDNQVLTDRWLLHFGFSHQVKSNEEQLSSTAAYGLPVMFEQSTSQYTQSYMYDYCFCANNSPELTTNYFLPGKLGGDHTIKAGYKYTRFEQNVLQDYGNSAQINFSSGTAPAFSTPLSVNLYLPSHNDAFEYNQAAYLQDTYTRKRLTLNLGIRWDHQRDAERAENIPASQFEGDTMANGQAFSFLPAVHFAGANSPAWNTFAPRLGATYDLFGRGRTVLKAAFGQYFDERFPGQLSSTYDTTALPTNGEGNTQNYVQLNFPGPYTPGTPITAATIATLSPTIRAFGGQFNPSNPLQTTSPNQLDPNIKDPKTNEIVVGVSQQIHDDWGFEANYIWRRFTDFIWNQKIGISSANYSSTTLTPTCGAAPAVVALAPICNTVTYFVPNITVPAAYITTNEPDYHQGYNGFELKATKRFGHRWMLSSAYTWQSLRQYWNAADAYQDPTNIAIQNGAQYAPSTGGYAVPVALNSKWLTRTAFRYEIPWNHGIFISGVLDYRQGYAIIDTINVATRPNSAGSVAVIENVPGANRFPQFKQLDIRVAKQFTVRERLKVEPAFDLYNLFNTSTELTQQPIQNSSTANLPGAFQQPRLARLSVRATW